MKDRLRILAHDVKSRGWRGVALACCVALSILGAISEVQHISKGLLEGISLVAFVVGMLIMNQDSNRNMRSAKAAVYGTIIIGTLWLTVFIETLQRWLRGVLTNGEELLPLAISTGFVVLFIVSGLATGNIGRHRTHIKGVPNKDLFN